MVTTGINRDYPRFSFLGPAASLPVSELRASEPKVLVRAVPWVASPVAEPELTQQLFPGVHQPRDTVRTEGVGGKLTLPGAQAVPYLRVDLRDSG